MTEVAEKTHARKGPSGADTWGNCAGSSAMSDGMPNNSTSYARWGTCAHEVAGIILGSAVKVNPTGDGDPQWAPDDAEAYVGRVFQIEGHDVEFDMEMAGCVNDYVAHVESFWEPGDVMIVEQAVPIDHITGEKDAEGTSDCIIIKQRIPEIIVIDLKGGKGVQVYAERSRQGSMYADGSIIQNELVYGPFEQVRVVIIQPRLNHVDEWAVSREEFDERIAEIKAEAELSNEADGAFGKMDEEEWIERYLVPGEKQCKFCNAKARPCPALEGAVSEALSLTAPPARAEEFPDLSIDKQAAAAVPGDDDRWIDEDKLAKAWKAIPLIEQWATAVRERVHALLHDGQPVGDLCLYEGRAGARFWSDAEQAEARLKKARVKADAMYDKKLISPTAAEKLYKDGTIPEKVFADLAEFIDRGDGKPVVGVQGDPKKTPWSPARPEEFPDLDAEEDDLFA